MMNLSWTSLMSEVVEPFCSALVDYLTSLLEGAVYFDQDEPFGQRRQRVMHQGVDLAWICGVDYVTKMGKKEWCYEPLVAICPDDSTMPIYHSDVIVRAESPFQSFADLRNTTWAYNEIESFSGYKIVSGHLAQVGEQGPFFGRKVKSGSHINSIAMVDTGQADTAAIDSTVIRLSYRDEPSLMSRVRIIARLGPYPMPPLVISRDCPEALRDRIQTVLTAMHQEPEGRNLLNRYQFRHFSAVNDGYYDSIRACLERSKGVLL